MENHSHSHEPAHSHAPPGHSSGHSHGHHHAGRGTRQLWVLSVLSGVYMLAEIAGGLISGSLALLADAGHLGIDVASITLSLFAVWISKRPPNQAKTYGYYRAEILAALVNGTALFLVALWIFYEAWQRLGAPHPIRADVMALVAVGGLAVNITGLALIHRRSKGNLNLRSVWLHLLTDAMGSIGSLIAAGLVFRFGWNLADPILSVILGVFILYGAFHLLSDCVNVLLEGVPKGMDLSRIRSGMESYPAVEEVHDLHVWTVTSGVHALSAHVCLKEDVDYCRALEGVIELLAKEFSIEHVTLQLEPSPFKHDDSEHLHA